MIAMIALSILVVYEFKHCLMSASGYAYFFMLFVHSPFFMTMCHIMNLIKGLNYFKDLYLTPANPSI